MNGERMQAGMLSAIFDDVTVIVASSILEEDTDH